MLGCVIYLCSTLWRNCVFLCFVLPRRNLRPDESPPLFLPRYFFFLIHHLLHHSCHPCHSEMSSCLCVSLWFLFILSMPLQYCDFLEAFPPVFDYSLCPHPQLHLYPFLAFLLRQVFWFILSSDIATVFMALVLLFSHSLYPFCLFFCSKLNHFSGFKGLSYVSKSDAFKPGQII